MFHFQCEWADAPATSARSGFELGHMTFAGPEGICTSRGRQPDQAMMLCVAIVELLDGLHRLLVEERSEFVFIGADSSFSIHFLRARQGRVAVRCDTASLGEVEAKTLYRAILGGVEEFVGRPENRLPEEDPAREDLFSSIEEFKRLLLPQ